LDQASTNGDYLGPLRDELLGIDREIVLALTRRISIVREIGEAKKAAGLAVYHPDREARVIAELSALASQEGLDPDLIGQLYPQIFAYSRIVQEEQRTE
jgi:chorismate mutase